MVFIIIQNIWCIQYLQFFSFIMKVGEEDKDVPESDYEKEENIFKVVYMVLSNLLSWLKEIEFICFIIVYIVYASVHMTTTSFAI